MKLWLDDVREPPAAGWTWVRTASSAVTAIATGQVTEISFDHDLGDDRFTGYDVAVFIEKLAHRQPLMSRIKWDIHSANPVGAKNIRAAMEAAERVWLRYGK